MIITHRLQVLIDSFSSWKWNAIDESWRSDGPPSDCPVHDTSRRVPEKYWRGRRGWLSPFRRWISFISFWRMRSEESGHTPPPWSTRIPWMCCISDQWSCHVWSGLIMSFCTLVKTAISERLRVFTANLTGFFMSVVSAGQLDSSSACKVVPLL
jgi:hypothetical protein